ncbi:MAG: TetR/AcrR family transcriptional regulator [Pseudomonadota bacterium]
MAQKLREPMPKRDEKYMAEQRSRIARKAYECLLEKGLHKTSVRDICARADISMGAFYTHFTNKNDIVEHALNYEVEVTPMPPVFDTWEGFSNQLSKMLSSAATDDIVRNSWLNYQLTAQCALASISNSYAVSAVDKFHGWLKCNLNGIQMRGELNDEIDTDAKTVVLSNLLMGASYEISMNPDTVNSRYIDNMLTNIATLIGVPIDRPGKVGTSSE